MMLERRELVFLASDVLYEEGHIPLLMHNSACFETGEKNAQFWALCILNIFYSFILATALSVMKKNRHYMSIFYITLTLLLSLYSIG